MRVLEWITLIVLCVAPAALAQNATVSNTPSTDTVPAALTAKPPTPPKPILTWDALMKEASVGNEIMSTSFVFNATNVSDSDVVITHTQTSCGCTVAEMPADPWVLKPGASGALTIDVDLTGKVGTLIKGIEVFLTNQDVPQFLTIKVRIESPPAMTDEERAKNRLVSQTNAQAIFKGACADCHLAPARGRMGASLYQTLCVVCHETDNNRRATMVPNLHEIKKTDYDFWKNTITNGKTNSLMPAFSVKQGGPLSDMQITSLAEHLDMTITKNNAALAAAAARRATNNAPVSGTPQTNHIETVPPMPKLAPIKAIDPVPAR